MKHEPAAQNKEWLCTGTHRAQHLPGGGCAGWVASGGGRTMPAASAGLSPWKACGRARGPLMVGGAAPPGRPRDAESDGAPPGGGGGGSRAPPGGGSLSETDPTPCRLSSLLRIWIWNLRRYVRGGMTGSERVREHYGKQRQRVLHALILAADLDLEPVCGGDCGTQNDNGKEQG